jgi:hypothetical protein
MRTKQEAIAAHIAKKIMANTQRRFSTLHSEALQEISMSKEIFATGQPTNGAPATRGESMKEATGTATTQGMAVGSQVNVGPIKKIPDHFSGEPTADVSTDGVQKAGTL